MAHKPQYPAVPLLPQVLCVWSSAVGVEGVVGGGRGPARLLFSLQLRADSPWPCPAPPFTAPALQGGVGHLCAGVLFASVRTAQKPSTFQGKHRPQVEAKFTAHGKAS